MNNAEDFYYESRHTGPQVDEAVDEIAAHVANRQNPHGVTKEQVGLGAVDNTPDTEKAVAYAALAGVANGIAPALLATLVTQEQLEQLVCDVEEDGLYFVDREGYIGGKIDEGGLSAINIPTFDNY